MATATDRAKPAFPQLNGKNYPTWKVQCKMALMKDGLWSIVDGSELRPLNDRQLPIYLERRNKALATIVLGVEPSLLYLLGDPEDPELVWKKLASQFQKSSWANKLSLRSKLHDAKLKKGEPIQPHIKSMIETFEELAVIGYPIEEEDKVVHLLTSLPDSFDMLRTALESTAEVPTLDVVTERLVHEDRKIRESKRSSNRDGSAQVFVGKHSKFKGKKKCFNCDQYGHLVKECPELQNDRETQGNSSRQEDSKEILVRENQVKILAIREESNKSITLITGVNNKIVRLNLARKSVILDL